VRLPEEFRLPGRGVLASRDGDRLIIEPVDALGWPIGVFDRLRADAARCEVPDIEPMPVRFLDLGEIDPPSTGRGDRVQAPGCRPAHRDAGSSAVSAP
jgi:virulence-associated protein VagC